MSLKLIIRTYMALRNHSAWHYRKMNIMRDYLLDYRKRGYFDYHDMGYVVGDRLTAMIAWLAIVIGYYIVAI